MEIAGKIKTELIFYIGPKKITKDIIIDSSKTTFGDILNIFITDISKKYNNYATKSKYFFSSKEIHKYDTIFSFIPKEGIKSNKIQKISIEINLDKIYTIYDENLPLMKKILIPNISNNKFGLFIYTPNKGYINIEEYDKNIYTKYELNKINSDTSYCNKTNGLYLSGGIFNNDAIDNFWIIDSSLYSIQKYQLPQPKCNHSMHPINDNHILIIGGNDTNAYLFNTLQKNFTTLANTNNVHIKPFIFKWNNFIYCFSINNDSLLCERILFDDGNKDNKWENIQMNNTNNEDEIENINDEKILIIFGKNNNYLFNPKSNYIEKVEIKNLDESFEFNSNDKNFYKVNKNYNIYIPKNFQNDNNLFVINRKLLIIHKMNFFQENQISKIKKEYNDMDIINEDNNINIKIVYDDKTDFTFYGYKKYLSKDSNDEIINFMPPEEEAHIDNTKYYNNNKIKLCIPKDLEYEQIIYRYPSNNSLGEKFTPKRHQLNQNTKFEFEPEFSEEQIFTDEEEKKGNEEDLYIIKKPNTNIMIPKSYFEENLIDRKIENEEPKIKINKTKLKPLTNGDNGIISESAFLDKGENVTNKNELKRNISHRIKSSLIIPNDSIDEQIIDRTIN